MPIALNVTTTIPTTGPDLKTPIVFNLTATNAIEQAFVSVIYLNDENSYMVYTTDGFPVRYSPVSSVGKTNLVWSFTIFEFGDWRRDILAIKVFGKVTGDPKFSLSIWDHRA